jgi:ATP/maltotriose-dependent transcriptional regulator MalT
VWPLTEWVPCTSDEELKNPTRIGYYWLFGPSARHCREGSSHQTSAISIDRKVVSPPVNTFLKISGTDNVDDVVALLQCLSTQLVLVTAQGFANKQIADRLQISETAVKAS